MREQKDKEIDGHTYLVTQMDAFKALRIQTKLIKLIGPGVTKMQLDKSGSIMDPSGKGVDFSKILGAIQPLLENVDDKELNNFVLSLFENGVMLQGKTTEGQLVPMPLDFKEHFVGRPMTMWKVAGFILEANFGLGKSLGLSSLTTQAET